MNYKKNSKLFKEYWQLRDSLNREIEKLVSLHSNNLKCKSGCSDCCLTLSLLPIEFFAIKQRIENSATFDKRKSCGFLNNDGACSIYNDRPLICRSHGLPIAYLDDEQDEPVNLVSYCPLNFTSVKPEDLEFNSETTLNIDILNSKLTKINSKFIKNNPELKDVFRLHMDKLLNKGPNE